MWKIVSVTVPDNQSVILFGGANNGQVIANPGQTLGSSYILAFPGLGYIKLIDRGNTVTGPGSWSVQLSNGDKNWFYGGEGQAHVTVQANGNYTWTGPGGANAVQGQLAAFQ